MKTLKTAAKTMAAAVMAASVMMPAVSAKDKRDIIGSYKDWDAIKITRTGGAKECYMLSSVKGWKASKRGVNRGDIYMTVTHKPSMGITGEVNVNVGYPMRVNSEAVVTIDGRKRFELFTEGNSAWAYDPQEDKALVKAMKAGSKLVVTGNSQRGTRTTDTYSLSGFTAAYNAITRACK